MKITLRRFNNGLSLVVIVMGLYIAITPFLPQLQYLLRDDSPEAIAPYAGVLASSEGSDASAPPPEDNRIVIPSIGVNEPIHEGNGIWTISDGGTWRRPNAANPFEDSNTVIVGHRFYGSEVSTFYHLDKVEVGQRLALYWNQQEIVYEVTEKKVVDPSQIEIEAPTAEKQLTIYTCDPVWTAVNRLVIVAKPVDSSTAQIDTQEVTL